MTNLAVLEKDNTYTFFEGKELIAKVVGEHPLAKEELEEYRKNPRGLRKLLLGEPQFYGLPKTMPISNYGYY